MDPKRWINVTAPPWPSSPLSPTPSDRQATAREHLDQPGDDRLQQRLQFVVCGRTGFDEYRHTIAAAPVHRVQHQAVGWHQRSNRFLRITKPLIFIGSVTDELRQSGTCGLIGLGEETLSVLLHQAVQRGLLGSVALVADRGAIAMRPPGVASVGLHALGMGNLGWCSFSGRAGRCIRLWGITYSHRHCNGPAAAQYLARQRRRRPCGSGHCAMASPARSIHRSGTAISTSAQSRRPTKRAENAYPRPRDRRLSRKTRAAEGKPLGATNRGSGCQHC